MKFRTLSQGKAILYNYNNGQLDTFQFSHGTLCLNMPGSNQTLFDLIIDGFNNDRPLKFILSEQKTVVKFDTLIVSNENSNMSAFYPNWPEFIIDTNKNIIFYQFQRLFNEFGDLTIDRNWNEKPDSVRLEINKRAYKSLLEKSDSLIKKNHDQFVSAVIINYLMNNNLLDLETVQRFYDYLSEPAKENYFGIRIGKELAMKGSLKRGSAAPYFSIVDLRGDSYRLTSIEKKKILLHFWSSTCAPCIKEAPDLIQLAKEFKNKVIVINISNDSSKEKWLAGLSNAGITGMINALDSTDKIFDDYSIDILPSYYLIDENKNIVMKGALRSVFEKLGELRNQ